MTPDEVKKYFGSYYGFNKATGMSHSTLYNWVQWGFVPEGQQCKLERITGGKLKAELKDRK